MAVKKAAKKQTAARASAKTAGKTSKSGSKKATGSSKDSGRAKEKKRTTTKGRGSKPRYLTPKEQKSYIEEIKAIVKSRGSVMKSFQVGDTVVEPSIGVCRIDGVKRQTIDNLVEDYYIFSSGSARVYVPVSQIEKRGVRRPMTKLEIRKIHQQLKVPITPTRTDARMQYLVYREVMRSGDPIKITRLLRELFTLDKMDELKGKEKEIMEQAKKFLVDEISFINEHPKAQVQEEIEESLGQMYKRKITKDREARAKRVAANN
jgi:CarD family transcriptional regulator